ncbi:MAG: substrate-binding domain-containing protein [Armatimonadetes bacterium]|nr:substrate-binding domain-containing protein [Armatimonadota bacterium]
MANSENTLKFIQAAALRHPFKECIRQFWKKHPGVNVELKTAGSRKCARMVIEGADVDLIGLADPAVFAELLVPHFVDDYYVIATDQIVITYDDFSRRSREINSNNWVDILLSGEVRFARADHKTVPCGYRTLMVWQLAEKYYQRPGIYQRLCDKSVPEDDFQSVTDLTAAVMEGRADYAFQYLSVARQFGLNYIKLPARINLSNPAHAGFYSEATVVIWEKSYSPKPVIIKGAPIEFAVAAAKHSRRKELAESFIAFVTGKEGGAVLEKCGLIPC